MWASVIGFFVLSLFLPWLVTIPLVTAVVFLTLVIAATLLYTLYIRGDTSAGTYVRQAVTSDITPMPPFYQLDREIERSADPTKVKTVSKGI